MIFFCPKMMDISGGNLNILTILNLLMQNFTCWKQSVPVCVFSPSAVSDCSPPGFSVHGLLQARILEWVVNSFLQGSFQIQGSNPRSPA